MDAEAIETGKQPLTIENQEAFCHGVAEGGRPSPVYRKVYDSKTSNASWGGAAALLKRPDVVARIEYLKAHVPAEKVVSGVDLKSVIATCKRIIDTAETNQERLSAINVLDKLGVFDKETKDDGVQRMDPAAICEYLATFAAHPASELARIPGGLVGLVKGLMELTGVDGLAMLAALKEVAGVEDLQFAALLGTGVLGVVNDGGKATVAAAGVKGITPDLVEVDAGAGGSI